MSFILFSLQLLVKNISDVLFWGSHPLKEAHEDVLWNIGTSHDGSKFQYSVLKVRKESIS